MKKIEDRGKLISAARESLTAKQSALRSLDTLMGTIAFSDAVNHALWCKGKIIITGIGKSGHIARKLAATFISTGQRAEFLHPAEAAHGDMAKIQPGDVVLMLSNSGATDELGPIGDRAVALACPMIMITGNPHGWLAEWVYGMCGDVLHTPIDREGDTINKAPMASCVAQIAVGDAIAAALMALRGFCVEDFGLNHHGGYLGRSIREQAA